MTLSPVASDLYVYVERALEVEGDTGVAASFDPRLLDRFDQVGVIAYCELVFVMGPGEEHVVPVPAMLQTLSLESIIPVAAPLLTDHSPCVLEAHIESSVVGANGNFTTVDTLDVATLGCTLDDGEELGETGGFLKESLLQLRPGLFSFTSDGADLFVSRAVPCVRQGSLIPTRLSAAICRHIEQTISSLSCERLCASDHLALLPCGIVVAPSTVTCNHLFEIVPFLVRRCLYCSSFSVSAMQLSHGYGSLAQDFLRERSPEFTQFYFLR